MEEYIFLVILALAYSVFASIQDLRTREISNWLNFSFLTFALIYRAFWSVANKDSRFFIFGLFGVGIFFLLALGFYYGRIFAGGDAKLFIAFGGLLPVGSIIDSVSFIILFIFVLFLGGAVYGLLYSLLLTSKVNGFWIEFGAEIKKQYWMFVLVGIMILFLLFVFSYSLMWVLSCIFFLGMPILYFYLKKFEKICMIKHVEPERLAEGDWLEKDVRVGRHLIKKNIHGLSAEDIEILRRAKKRVLIKEGIPFAPAFLIALIIMGYFLAVSGFEISSFLKDLF